MENLVDSAYQIGGVSGVIVLALVTAVVYLYRAREKEHRDRLREARESSALMMRLLDKASVSSRRPGPLPSASIPPPGDEDEESTVVTHLRRQQVHQLVIRYMDDDEE